MNNKKKTDIKALILNIGIGILAFSLMVFVVKIVNEVNYDYKDYANKTSHYINSFKPQKYHNTTELYYHDMARGNDGKDMKECMAVAEYYVAVSHYKVYENDAQKGTVYLEKMKDAESRMGDFLYMAEEIKGLFGVTVE